MPVSFGSNREQTANGTGADTGNPTRTESVEPSARTIPAPTTDKPEGWSEWDIWDQMDWLAEQHFLSSVSLYRCREDSQLELLETFKHKITLDDIRTRYGTGAFQLHLQRLGQRGCYARSQVIHIGPGPRIPAVSGQSPANQPNYAVSQPMAQPPQDLGRVVADAVASAMGGVRPVAAPTDSISREEFQRLMREEREASERRAAEAAEKARLHAEIEALRREVADAKNAPAKALESDPGLVTTLVGQLVALKTETAKSGQVPSSLADPIEGVRQLRDLSKEFGSGGVSTGAAVADAIKEITKAISPAAEALAAGVAANQKASMDIQAQLALTKLNMDAQRQAVELQDWQEKQRHKRQLELVRAQQYNSAEFLPSMEADSPAPIQPVKAQLPAREPVQESPTMAGPLRVFVTTVMDEAREDEDRPEAQQIGLDAIIDRAMGLVAAGHGEDGLDTVIDAFEPYLAADLTDATVQNALLDMVLGSLPWSKRQVARAGIQSKAVRQAVLSVVSQIQSYFAALARGDQAVIQRLEAACESRGAA